MEQFENINLSESKRPILLENEIELLIQEGVTLFEKEQKTKYIKGIATLTSFRIIWIDKELKLPSISLLLSKISSIHDKNWNIKSSPKIQIHFKGKSSDYYIKLSFKSGGRDIFFSKLKTALQNKAWEKIVSNIETKKKETFATSKAGITGIMRTVETKARETDKTIQQAFTDINALMEKAKDLVLLAEKFATQQSKESKNEDTELRSVLISMGISSPVTKESAGSLYHNQLSRQLADWLQKPLQKFGGIIALTDLYCIFNRARGTEMISPDDLYRACMLFEELKLPVRLRKFESGVLVVQSINETDNIIAKQIADLVRVDGPQTAFDIAKTKNISLALATEELLTAEKQGLICRDETYEGLVYYLNFFNDINLVKLYIK